MKQVKAIVLPWQDCEQQLNDAVDLAEMVAEEGEEEEMLGELSSTAEKLEKQVAQLEITSLLSDEADVSNCYIHINPGAGGTESCDWAQMLLRMYTRFLEIRGWSYKTLELQPGDEAGVKSAQLYVEGDFAYGYLKAETGIHRLVRISPFDANKRRHTSFASVYVSPEVDDSIEIEVLDKDLRIDTYRASGAGGQHVNKTDSAVRITHIPTNIVVACQNERSQHQNKDVAMQVLKSRLYQLEMEKRIAEAEDKAADKQEIGWGSQIRSYVFQPYQMVKDHRTNIETGNTSAVMDGQIEDFITGYLQWSVAK